MSQIEWTDKVWNPIIGCSRHSAACDHCYAITIATRFAGNRAHWAGTVKDGDWTGLINRAPAHIFNKPMTTKAPTVWFVNSMSDLFHHSVQDADIVDVFRMMNATPRHQYQVLTKRPQAALKRAEELGLTFTPNIWMGASVGENKFAFPTVRALSDMKRKFGIQTIFVSAEPLLEALPSLDVLALDWLIVGGESGNRKTVRAMNPQWARELRDRCRSVNTPFFFKQWGKFGENGKRGSKDVNGHLLDGEEIFEMPATVYDAMPKPSPKWTRVEAAMTPVARFQASNGRWIINGQPEDDYVQAVAAKLSDASVNDNANWRADPADVVRLESLLTIEPQEFWEILIRADLPEGEARRLLRQLEESGRAVKLPDPLRYSLLSDDYLWLVGEAK